MRHDELIDVEFGEPEHERGWPARLAVFLGMIVLVGAAIVAIRSIDGDTNPDGDSSEADVDDDDPVTEVGEIIVEIESAGRANGLDSARRPAIAVPDDGLVDQQSVTLSAQGFPANTNVAVVQCAGIDGAPGGEGNCDVGNYTLFATDDLGAVTTAVTVRRYISNSAGVIDCADPGEFQCVAVIANIADYDDSAVANLWFDPTVDGVEAPLLTLDRTDGLEHGDTVTVTGTGFPADTAVIVGECVIGGSSSIHTCWYDDARVGEAVSDAHGSFVITVEVSRTVSGSSMDCFGSIYGCRIAARADVGEFQLGDGTAANPVKIWFNGTTPPDDIEWGVAYSMNPDRDLRDGETLTLRLGNLIERGECVYEEIVDANGEVVEVIAMECAEVAIAGGAVDVQQCLDLAGTEEYCSDPVIAEITDGVAEVTVTLERWITRDNGEVVDCAEAAGRCELRLSGDVWGHVPLRFAAEG